MKKTIRDIDLRGKTVVMRVDFNVPIKDGVITDNNRIVQAIPTIQYAVEKGAKVVLLSHLGRVKTEEDLAKNSLEVVAKELSSLMGKQITFFNATRGETIKKAVSEMQKGNIIMLQNTRYEDLDGKKESKNDPELASFWASLGDVFVNDAFGTAHRAHASNAGIASILKDASVAGLLLEKEIKYLSDATNNPRRPFVAILGGAKVSDKIGVIKNLLTKTDTILIGGAMANTFLKATGVDTKASRVEEDQLELARELLASANGRIILPTDAVVVKEINDNPVTRICKVNELEDGEMIVDIGPETCGSFDAIIQDAKTVVWNGPMGIFEIEALKQGTLSVCESIARSEAISIIGGGDSAAAAISMGYADKFTHISTGGGASLEYLEGKELPGIECLTDK